VEHSLHTSHHHPVLMSPLCLLLFLELLTNVGAERDLTALIGAVLGMVTAEGDELFADWTMTALSLFTCFRVLDDAFHFVATQPAAVGISTGAGVDEGLNAPLNTLVSGVLILF
jgi:hypothetical protein